MIIFNLLSFVIVVVAILAMDDHKQDARFVFVTFQNNTGFGNSYACLLGLLQAAFGMTGYGMFLTLTHAPHLIRDHLQRGWATSLRTCRTKTEATSHRRYCAYDGGAPRRQAHRTEGHNLVRLDWDIHRLCQSPQQYRPRVSTLKCFVAGLPRCSDVLHRRLRSGDLNADACATHCNLPGRCTLRTLSKCFIND